MKAPGNSVSYFLKLNLATLLFFYLLRLAEFFYFKANLIVPTDLPLYELLGFVFDTMFWATYCIIFWIVLLPVKSNKAKNFVSILLGVVFIVSNISLQLFFVERGAPLDKELILNSISNSITTVKSSNLLNFKVVLLLGLIIAVYLILVKWISRKRLGIKFSFILVIFSVLAAGTNIALRPDFFGYKYSANKTNYLVKSVFGYLANKKERSFSETEQFVLTAKMKSDIELYQKQHGYDFVASDYPLLRKRDTLNTLGTYFNLGNEKPNVVFLVVESLSRDICGPNAELGNFVTPFLDSLAEQSLFWGNCLSTSAISFEMLPSSLGSLPYGQFGFSMLPKYPNHLSLVKVLRENGYHSSFITGAPMHFDNQGAFMRNQGTDFLSYNFPEKYSKMNQDNGWNWGYPDKVIFDYGFEKLNDKPQGPYLDTYVTIVTHPPYNFDDKEAYGKIFDERLGKLEKTDKEKQNLIKIRDLLSAFVYTDQSISEFFKAYKKRPDYNNTIFVITGDHHGYFEPKNELGKFHVPLMIYSPLLKDAKQFKSMVSHLDIVPSLINLLKAEYDINLPEYEHWLGNPLNNHDGFELNKSMPLIDWNKTIHYYVDGEHFLHKNKVYKIVDDHLNLKQLEDTAILNNLRKKLDVFKSVNAVCCYNNAIMPDSLMYKSDLYKTIIAEEYINQEIVSTKKYPSTFKAQLEKDQTEIKVEIEFEVILPKVHNDSLPKYVILIESDGDDEKEFSDTKDLAYLNNGNIKTGDWVKMNLVEQFKLSDIAKGNSMQLKAYFFNPKQIELRIRNYSFRILN